ncbi:MAG TPA: T9SS type A sorting domain-containing protein [Saprospiraceae bacterium]|nr:T9SS type A sorting domain-containing protein [Saprospiraceae bacterium]HMP23375.1 T9SS type A sorting domain-containing protein [Saprospiraceae bacterium]
MKFIAFNKRICQAVVICTLCFGAQEALAQLCAPNCPTLELSLSTDANNVVTLTGCANGDFQASDGTDDWANSVVTIRIPAGNMDFPISVSAPNPSTEVTFLNSGIFDGITLIPQFNNPGIITFTLDQVNGVDDGYIYMQFVDNVSAPNFPLSDGTCVPLLQIQFPSTWTCNDCIEMMDDFAPPGVPIYMGTRIANSGVGGDVDSHADPFTTLPIELKSFLARTTDCNVALHWETATERNFGYFQIEASKDGRAFATAAQQKPASPNSSTPRTYRYAVPTDLHNHYFRLKAVDLDGSFEYSPIVFAKAPCNDKRYDLTLYPNPNYASELMVELSSPELVEQVEVHLMDTFGKTLRIERLNLQPGVNKVPIETEGLPSGAYFIKIIGIEQLSEPLKFVRSNF